MPQTFIGPSGRKMIVPKGGRLLRGLSVTPFAKFAVVHDAQGKDIDAHYQLAYLAALEVGRVAFVECQIRHLDAWSNTFARIPAMFVGPEGGRHPGVGA